MAETIRNNYDIGRVLRRLRRERNLTGEQLAHQANMSQSKISKIEIGFYEKLRQNDIELLLNILEAPKIIRQQILGVLGRDTTISEQRHIVWNPINVYELESKSTQLRTFSYALIPALLQTMEYRNEILRIMGINLEDLAKHLQLTIKRQDRLWQKGNHFHFIFTEAALYTAPLGNSVQLSQLDRLERFIGMQRIKIGIVPMEAGLEPLDCSPFVLYDNKILLLITASYETPTEDISLIADHIKIFTDYDRRAVYGEESIRLIRKAMDYFS